MKEIGPRAPAISERTLLRMILREFGSRPDVRLFRNNVGVAVYRDGSRVAYGLCPGSSDLIGFQTVPIVPRMVGGTIARFVAIEVKGASGQVASAQSNFLTTVGQTGGVAVLARSTIDVREALKC